MSHIVDLFHYEVVLVTRQPADSLSISLSNPPNYDLNFLLQIRKCVKNVTSSSSLIPAESSRDEWRNEKPMQRVKSQVLDPLLKVRPWQ